MIFKTLVAAGIFWGALYAAQHYLLVSMTSQITANSGLNLLPPAPAFPTMEIDPARLRQAINPPVTIDTKKYERLAIDGMVRQMDQQNRAIQSQIPRPPSIPGLHR
jgi:hypothetical protein